ncbi:hypothetical protein PUNSTDRAFT_77964 [Punctularia strigosozonata HHB-11173 SS5]|uniref:C4-dicarboxylate transporter/malic acid transport protein n=1 Tax=Punctularia strigosozonata (strain HHB-11173) TaxID=741275 RepID=R7S2S5_PUNST|nr:uncharacterized protein PUNSTDRAFT_77964 [Punctularia strigosozonata HHB-11173 SS5]EIN03551.1 hypothetical protein PUNSTDRAFT_77964 [Punctularia strigosozonata HHB-11173 SS5]
MSATSLTSTLPTTTEHVGIFARRVHGWSWQAFSVGMGTGAVYVSLIDIHLPTLLVTHIATAFLLLSILIFLVNLVALALQAVLYPPRSLKLMTDPKKAVLVPLSVLSLETIIIGIVKNAVPDSHISMNTAYALFWTYVFSSVLACFPMLMTWFNNGHDVTDFTPGKLMLVGVVTANVLDDIPPTENRAIGVLLVGYFFQGLGTFITLLFLSIYFVRLVSTGFMKGPDANAAFVAVGPPGFTALALLGMGIHARDILPAHHLICTEAGDVFYAVSALASLMLFGLAVFLFLFGALPWWSKLRTSPNSATRENSKSRSRLQGVLGCWSLTFPNVGWIATVRVLGDTFSIPGFYTLHLILVVAMCLVWLTLFVLTMTAFWKGDILLSEESLVLRDRNHFAGDACPQGNGTGSDGAEMDNIAHPNLMHVPTLQGDLEQGPSPND